MCKVKTNLPLLSIRLMVFNHADFLEECLNSINEQKTNFKFELVIGDDFSEDNSFEILKNFSFSNSNISVNLLERAKEDTYHIQRKKLGRLHNFIDILDNCKGKYIALLDGDDYWTDPLKLQKQVDFLEDNEDYGICFHESAIEWDNNHVNSNIELNSQFPWNKMNASQSTYTIGDVFNGPFMATASVVYRNNFVKEFPSWFHEAASGDITLFALIIGDKKIKFINEIMSVYRRHDGGITRFHKGSSIIINRIVTLKSINSFYKGVYKIEIQKSVSNYLNSVTLVSFKDLLILYKVFMTSNIVKKNLLGILTCYVLKNQLKKFV